VLVLSRQKDQTIMIGDDIGVTVVDIRGDKVRLGITAPKHVSVHRREVYEAIQRKNRDASRFRPQDVPQWKQQQEVAALSVDAPKPVELNETELRGHLVAAVNSGKYEEARRVLDQLNDRFSSK
jgi:carbon storage regulator